MGSAKRGALVRSAMVAGLMSCSMLVAPSVALGAAGVESSVQAEGVASAVLEHELEELAEREAANPELADFVGGSPVVIVVGTTALLVALVVVLLVLLFK